MMLSLKGQVFPQNDKKGKHELLTDKKGIKKLKLHFNRTFQIPYKKNSYKWTDAVTLKSDPLQC